MSASLVLASASPFRRMLLKNAGIPFVCDPASIDERAVEEAIGEATGEDIAAILAEAKAQDVAARHGSAIVIGSDQTLSLDGALLHKVADMDEARRRLLLLQGRTHELNSALALVKDGETIWRHVSIARMTMRPMTPEYIGRHLALAGDGILKSVGAYQLEGPGVNLFSAIDGDYFTVLGLPLLPLLGELRVLGAIDG